MIASQGTEWLTADGLGYFLDWETYRKNKILRWALKEGIKKSSIAVGKPQTLVSILLTCNQLFLFFFFLTNLDDYLLLAFVSTLFLPSEISKILQCRDHRISEAIGHISQSFFSLSLSKSGSQVLLPPHLSSLNC